MNEIEHVTAYRYPAVTRRSLHYSVSVDGVEQFVYHNAVGDFVCLSFQGCIDVTVTCETDVSSATIRPLDLGIKAEVAGNIIHFSISKPMNVWIDIGDSHRLYLFANQLEAAVPKPDDPGVHFFKAGQVYDVGEMTISTGEIVYIEGGAVVRGCLLAVDSTDIKIFGRGIFDGSYFNGSEKRRSILFEQCSNVTVDDIIMIDPSSWMLVFTSCRDIVVRNLKQIGQVASSDGVDIVGSSNVVVDGCFINNNDDCVVIKSMAPLNAPGPARDVDNVLIQNCVFINDRIGHAMEIGHELLTDSVRNITFRNCDILSVHGHGAVFAIHNGDWAVVSDVLWEDIRVEHHYDKLIDIRIIKSRYCNPDRRGQVRNVHIKNARISRTVFNEGYTTSLIGGYDAEHTVENVTLEDFYIDGVKILDADALDLFTKQVRNIEFL